MTILDSFTKVYTYENFFNCSKWDGTKPLNVKESQNLYIGRDGKSTKVKRID